MTASEHIPEIIASVLGLLATVAATVKLVFDKVSADVKSLREEVAAMRLELAAEGSAREAGDEKSYSRADNGLNKQALKLDDHATRVGRIEGFLGSLGGGPASFKAPPP